MFVIILLYIGGLIGLGVGCMVVANNGLEGYEEWTNPEMLRIAAYVCWSVAGISILVLCCNLSKIRVAAAIIRSAAEFTRQECKIIVVPFLMFLSMVIVGVRRACSLCFGSTLQCTSSVAERLSPAKGLPTPALSGR